MINHEMLIFSQEAVDNKIKNTPSSLRIIRNLQQLQIFLSSLEKILDIDILVNSGYRCPELNDLVHGSSNSYHLYGLAADITIENTAKCTLSDLKSLCKELRKTRLAEIVIHDTYIHLAIKPYY